jgi:hypothetical protein
MEQRLLSVGHIYGQEAPHYGTHRFITAITKALNMNPLNSVYIFTTNRAGLAIVVSLGN